jgi:hypothetical protein
MKSGRTVSLRTSVITMSLDTNKLSHFLTYKEPTYAHCNMHNNTTRSLLYVSAELRHIQGVYTPIFKTFWYIIDYNSSTIISCRHTYATEPVIEPPPTHSISTHDMGTRAIIDRD